MLSAGWLACRGPSLRPHCLSLRVVPLWEIKEKADGGGGGKEEKGDAAAQARGLGGGLRLDWIGSTARPRTAAAARIRCSGPDSVAHRCAAPRAAPAPGDLAGRRDLAQICSHFTSEHGTGWFRSASAGCCVDLGRV